MAVTDCADAHSAPATVVADLKRSAKMKYALILIGVILLFGGFSAVLNPHAMIMPMGGSRYNPTVSYHALSKEEGSWLGYVAICMGLMAVGFGLTSKSRFIPPPKYAPFDEKDDSAHE